MTLTFDFQNKKVLVTGGASGIGAATVKAFLASGAQVAVFDKQFEVESKDERLWQIPVDLLDIDQIDNAFEKLYEWGSLDILVNNAGIEFVGTVEETSEEQWDRVFDTNLKSIFRCTKRALPWIKASQGVIVNTASQLGFVGADSFTAYTAAKAAVVNFTRSLALEVASSGVRANSVCPGAIDTELLRRQFADGKRGPQGTLDDLIAMHPVGRLGQPHEIAGGILFLCSDASTFMTGSSLVIDGGYTSR